MEIWTIIISSIALLVSIGALWLSINAFNRSKNIEKPSLVTAHFIGGDRLVCVLNDYSSSKNLRIDKIEVEQTDTNNSISIKYETRYNDTVKPPQLVITSTDVFNTLLGYKIKMHTNYGLLEEELPELLSEK